MSACEDTAVDEQVHLMYHTYLRYRSKIAPLFSYLSVV